MKRQIYKGSFGLWMFDSLNHFVLTQSLAKQTSKVESKQSGLTLALMSVPLPEN